MAHPHTDRTAMSRSGARELSPVDTSGGATNGRVAAPRNPSAADQDHGGEITALLGSIRRRWLLITVIGLIVSASAVSLIWFFVEPPFQATAEIHIREVPDRILFKTEDPAGFSTYKQTQMRMVKSMYVLSAALRHPEIAQLSMVREQEHPIDWLQKELKVDSPATEFIQISLEGDRPHELAAIVKAVTEAYQEEVANAEDERKRNRLNELRNVESRIEDDLREKRKAMQALAKTLSTTDSEALSTRQQLATEYYGQLRREHAQIRFELMRLQARIAARKKTGASAEDVEVDEKMVLAQLEKLPEIQKYRQRRQQLVGQLEIMKKRFESDQHASIVAAESQLQQLEGEYEELRAELKPVVEEELREQILEDDNSGLAGLEQQAEVLTVQFEEIEKELNQQKVESNEMGLSSYQLEVQKRRIAESEQMGERIKERIQQIEVELDAQPRVTVFQEVEVPHTPMVARKYKLMGFAGFGGFAFIASVIVWSDLLSKRVSSIREVVHGLKLPILGALPIMPRGLIDGKTRKGGRPEALLGLWKESIDSTRAMLLSHAGPRGEHPRQTIMVTSALSGEGKTTLACHLAISLAQAGRKTLLVDADLRRPAIHQVFGISGDRGLSDLLRQEEMLGDVIQNPGIAGLSVMPAGHVDPYALHMLAADAAGPLLEELKSEYDFIVVDSAPVLPVTDALMIGPHVDGALFAVRRDVSRRGKITSACERLEMIGVPLMGAVVIGLESQEPTDRYTPYGTQNASSEPVANGTVSSVT